MKLSRLAARIRDKNLQNWLPAYLRQKMKRGVTREPKGHKHLLFAICDHYEPLWGGVSHEHGLERMSRWENEYPAMAKQFVDSQGRHPRHSFFFPGEQYHPDYGNALASLARAGFGEVELHLHHDQDTSERLREDIARYTKELAEHGHFSRDPQTGDLRYAFIHGNWCLANARKDGRWCGVDDEVQLLWDTGCYADFTFPAAPNESQPGRVNEIYWPTGDRRRRRAYEHGETARVGKTYDDRLLFIQGPLSMELRPGKRSVRIENGDLHGGDPPTAHRLKHWVRQGVSVKERPDWIFVKVHTHGAPEKNAGAMLGEPTSTFHAELIRQYRDRPDWTLHYVTAREMFNVSKAAMNGESGNPREFYDYEIPPPPVAKK